MTEQHNTENLTTKQEVKLEWNTPKIELLPINEETLAGSSIFIDGGGLS